MDLMTLTSGFQPNKLIENFKSLIWTERYSVNGDFALESYDIGNTLKRMPLESYVALRDSTVVMVVEAHKINKPKNDAPILTVSGRTFETVLERRASVKGALPIVGSARPIWVVDAIKASDAAYLVMRTVLGDVARYKNGTLVLPATNPSDMASALDAIPEIDLTLPFDFEPFTPPPAWDNATAYTDGTQVKYSNALWKAVGAVPAGNPPSIVSTYWTLVSNQISFEVSAQDLYKTVTEYLEMNRHGIKSVRPLASDIFKTGVEIYNGANLTGAGANSDPNNVYVFSAKFDQFDESTYLLSSQGSTNVAYSYGPNGAEIVNKTAAAEPSGLARRVLAVNNDSSASTIDVRRSRALVELYKNNSTALFDGKIADLVARDYNVKYFLGDILSLYGEYGLKNTVRVKEYIRSLDDTGETAFPTFETVDVT